VRRFAGEHVDDDRTVAAIALCVTEAVTNVLIHAYRDRPGPGPARVEGSVAADALWIAVRDEGVGLVPRLDSPGLGLGLALILQTASEALFQTCAGGGTEVRMRFPLKGEQRQLDTR